MQTLKEFEEKIRKKWLDKTEGVIQAELACYARHEQKRQDEAECAELQRQREPYIVLIESKTGLTQEQQEEDAKLVAKLSAVRKRMPLFIGEIVELGNKLERLKEALAQ